MVATAKHGGGRQAAEEEEVAGLERAERRRQGRAGRRNRRGRGRGEGRCRGEGRGSREASRVGGGFGRSRSGMTIRWLRCDGRTMASQIPKREGNMTSFLLGSSR